MEQITAGRQPNNAQKLTGDANSTLKLGAMNKFRSNLRICYNVTKAVKEIRVVGEFTQTFQRHRVDILSQSFVAIQYNCQSLSETTLRVTRLFYC
jgi:hypothetical protein